VHTETISKFNDKLDESAQNVKLFGVDDGNGVYIKLLASDEESATRIGESFLKFVKKSPHIHQVDELDVSQPQIIGIERY